MSTLTTPGTRVFYLNNKTLLEEIHKSKITYCSFIDKKYENYDAIVKDKKEITKSFIEETRLKKAQNLTLQNILELKAQGYKTSQIKIDPVDPQTIPTEDLVFRIMEYWHIPQLPPEELKNKKGKDAHVKCNFPPFCHYIIKNNNFVCVGKSHWVGDLNTGYFSDTHGKTTNKLAMMYMSLVERYSQKGNWHGYSYVSEFQSQALLQLSHRGLFFCESQSNNPFAYFTQIAKNSFTRVLNIEKKNQKMRDDILQVYGSAPSYTRQIDSEFEQRDIDNHKTKQSDISNDEE